MLTRYQRKVFAKYRDYRTRPPSFARHLVAMLPQVVVLGLFVTIAQVYVSTGLALFVGGMSLGAILRQGSIAWRSLPILPILVEVIDWPKVDFLLRESDPKA